MVKSELEELINAGYSVTFISKNLNKSKHVVRYWLKKYNIDYLIQRHDGKWGKKKILAALDGANSLSDIIRNLDLNVVAGNYITLKKYAKLYGIDLEEYKYDFSKHNPGQIHNKKSEEEVFCINSTIARGSVKRRFIELLDGESKCFLCGQNEIWKGRKMSLVLDHINGVNDDNRIENLRLVCPNCNATLPTHCRGSKGLIPPEKKELNKEEILSKRSVERPPLHQLLKEVKELGYVGTGKKYGVSDNAIRKWVKFYEKHGF